MGTLKRAKVQDEKERLKPAKRKKEPSRNKNTAGNKRKLALINILIELRQSTTPHETSTGFFNKGTDDEQEKTSKN